MVMSTIMVPNRRRVIRGASVSIPSLPWTANANTFIVHGVHASDTNETGEGGGLSGANLVWTQNNGIAGNGTYRTLDGVDDYFSATTGFRDMLAGAAQYGILFKLENWNPDTDYEAILKWAANDLIFRITTNAGAGYRFDGLVNGNAVGTTVNGIPNIGVIYCYLGCDGADTMVGFTQAGSGADGIPIQKADFAANDRALRGATTTMPAVMSEANPDIFRDSSTDNRYVGAKFHWAVICNNDSLIGAL